MKESTMLNITTIVLAATAFVLEALYTMGIVGNTSAPAIMAIIMSTVTLVGSVVMNKLEGLLEVVPKSEGVKK